MIVVDEITSLRYSYCIVWMVCRPVWCFTAMVYACW